MVMRSFKIFGLATLVAIAGASLTSSVKADDHHHHHSHHGYQNSHYGNYGSSFHHNHHPNTGYYGYRPPVVPYPSYGYGYSSNYGGYNGFGAVPHWGGYGVGSFPRGGSYGGGAFPRGGSYGGGGFSLYIGRLVNRVVENNVVVPPYTKHSKRQFNAACFFLLSYFEINVLFPTR